jgi:hypothetical protein
MASNAELRQMATLEHARKARYRSYVDEDTGCAYYFDTETGEVTWDPPRGK